MLPLSNRLKQRLWSMSHGGPRIRAIETGSKQPTENGWDKTPAAAVAVVFSVSNVMDRLRLALPAAAVAYAVIGVDGSDLLTLCSMTRLLLWMLTCHTKTEDLLETLDDEGDEAGDEKTVWNPYS